MKYGKALYAFTAFVVIFGSGFSPGVAGRLRRHQPIEINFNFRTNTFYWIENFQYYPPMINSIWLLNSRNIVLNSNK